MVSTKRNFTKMSTPNLLIELSRDANDDDWDKAWGELNERCPFDEIQERLLILETMVDTLKEKNDKLEGLLKNHKHLDGKVVVEL